MKKFYIKPEHQAIESLQNDFLCVSDLFGTETDTYDQEDLFQD